MKKRTLHSVAFAQQWWVDFMTTLPLNQAYRADFEQVVGLLKAAQERGLSEQESQLLKQKIAACRAHERSQS